MRENAFKDYKTAYDVLSYFDMPKDAGAKPLTYSWQETRNQALDRIRELTPPAPRTVTEEQRERARSLVTRWLFARGMTTTGIGTLLDEVIDALGITDPEPVAPVANRVAVKKEEWERAVNAASEHRFVDHQSTFGDRCFCGWTSHEVPHAEHQIAYVLDALGCMGLVIHEPVAPVADALHHQCADAADDCCDRQPEPVVKAVDVDADTLRLIVSLSEWSDVRVPHDLEGTMNAVRFALYRDEDGKTRVVIGGAL